MKKRSILFTCMILGSFFVFSSNLLAADIPYWQLTSTDAEFLLLDSDDLGYLELGVYTVDDWTSHTLSGVDYTTLFSAGAAAFSSAQLFPSDLSENVFGFYVFNTNNSNLFYSDELLGPNDNTRLQILPRSGVDQWDIVFYKTDGTTVRLLTYGDDIAPVPEPATMLLLGIGLIGVGVATRKKIFKN